MNPLYLVTSIYCFRSSLALAKYNKAGIPAGVMTAPIIPGLNSDEIPDLIKAAADHGADCAGYTIVRLNGSIAEIFKDWIYKNFPDRAEKVLHHIADAHGGQLSDSRYGKRMSGEGNMVLSICHVAGLTQHGGRTENLSLMSNGSGTFRTGCSGLSPYSIVCGPLNSTVRF